MLVPHGGGRISVPRRETNISTAPPVADRKINRNTPKSKHNWQKNAGNCGELRENAKLQKIAHLDPPAPPPPPGPLHFQEGSAG